MHYLVESGCPSASPPVSSLPPIRVPSLTQVWMKDFGGLLRIRSEGHHSRCAICVRHRLIIRRVGRGPARRQQIIQFKRHLSRQYRDRQIYWGHRCKSRDDAVTGAPATFISCIVDGMDQQKHSCPRSEAMSSKEFNSWNRPRLQSTTLIVHGHCVLTALSPSNTPAGGSRTMEILAYAMTKPLSYVHWPNVFLCLEADNCSKELKHQTGLRMFATMIAQCQLRGCEFNYLQSGHSHEDVDAFFSIVSAHIERHRELWDIEAFKTCLESMFKNRSLRPHERIREVVVFDQFHDWILSYGWGWKPFFESFIKLLMSFWRFQIPPPRSL